MALFHLISVIVTLAAVFSYINLRMLKLPTTIGVMLIALALSLGLIVFNHLGLGWEQPALAIVRAIDFDETLLHGMLSFLLFAGALHINLEDLAQQKFIIGFLATMGVVGSTFLLGGISWLVFDFLNIPMSMLDCLLFGALISPTDPIAVLAILKQANVPKSLETKIAGESLFNDGVAVVVFIVLLHAAGSGHEIEINAVLRLFFIEAVGGILFGLLIGAIAYWMLQSVDNYQVEILTTLAVVTGGFSLAEVLHVSAPLAVVVAGLLVGNQGRVLAMSEKTKQYLDSFWELIDEILNAILFVLIGLELLIVEFKKEYLLAAIIMIPLLFMVRGFSVGLPVAALRRFRPFSPHVTKILTWGGLRGGISVALALSLPQGPGRPVIIAITYAVVVFSIAVQGLTIGPITKRLQAR